MAEVENIEGENGEQVMVLEIQTENNAGDNGQIWSRYKGLYELERDREATMLLIDMYQKYCDKLNNKYTRKKFVWEAIAAELTSMGYQVDGDRCHQKWRNMERIFRKHLHIVKNMPDSEKLKNTPEFFDKMFTVVGNKQFRSVSWASGSMNQDVENSSDEEADLSLADIDGSLTDMSRKRPHSLASSSSLLMCKRPRTVTDAIQAVFKTLSEQQEQHSRLLREQLNRHYERTEKTFQAFLDLLAQQQLIQIEQPPVLVVEAADDTESIDIVTEKCEPDQ